MASINWFFRERDPGEAFRGGNDNFAFQMSIDTLVRETIQNSNDQRIGEKVTVDFIFEHHSGKSSQQLLELVGWSRGLQASLQSISKAQNHLSRRADKVLRDVDSGEFSSLTIRDSGARGLEGAEDGEAGNFVMLCRHVLVTDANRKALKGGSFGIGKSVIWAFSGASVAIFSSLPLEYGDNKRSESIGQPRVFGRAYLVSHKVAGKDYTSDGHLGNLESQGGKSWAVSVRGNDAKNIVKGTALDRDWRETGTSILIPFLDNPRDKEPLEATQVLEEIRLAVQRWFWPSIAAGLLEVRIGTRIKGAEKLEKVELPIWSAQFRRAEQATDSSPIAEEGGASTLDLALQVPEREAKKAHKRAEGHTTLGLTRLMQEPDECESVPSDLVNSVALIRGAHMVVEYHSRSFSSLLPPFVGVVKAGSYRGDTTNDHYVETFLRDSEPPAHDKWDPAAIKLSENYKRGGQSELKRFFENLGSSAASLLGTNTPATGRVPRKLAEMLRGGKGGKTKRIERFSMIDKEIDRDKPDVVHASFTLRRNSGSGEWRATCSIVLIDEQGTSRELNLSDVNEDSLKKCGLKVNFVRGNSSEMRKAVELVVPSALETVEVELKSEIPVSKVAMRSMADVKVSYHQSERVKN